MFLGASDVLVVGNIVLVALAGSKWGGFGIWWLVDWILIIAGKMKDGNGQDLAPDL